MERRSTARSSGLSALLKAVIAAVKLVASEEIMPRYKRVTHQRKSDGSLCTEADLAAQEALTRKLQTILNVPVIGEEMEREEQEALWAQGLESGLWCIDPIDGTSNFVRGLPYFAVSVALIRDGRSVLGVVYDPVGDEVFAAERGRGVFLNGERLLTRKTADSLAAALVNVDLKRLDHALAARIAARPPFSSQRNFGACTLDWCYTAAGRFDAYLHGGQKLWDYAAGSLILQEAGGQACCLGHDDFHQGDIWQRSVIAALDATLFEQWKSWVHSQ
jgi:myo-inositol-1(or 4)-monophosphatase